MGWFNRKPQRAAEQRTEVVVVAFRDLDRRDPLKNFSPEHGYAYVWPFREKPRVGQWAVAPGIDGPATVIVGAIGLPQSSRGMELKSLLRQLPQSDVDQAIGRRESNTHAWLNMARQTAGLPPTGPMPRTVPTGFDPVPPVDGAVTAATAHAYGTTWWRAYKQAEAFGREPDEIALFESIARGWYRRARAMEKSDTLERVTRKAQSIDIGEAVRRVTHRSKSDIGGMIFEGIFLADWLRYVEELSRQKRYDDALEILGALITAAEQKARLDRAEPAPAYTKRAAIIYRKKREYANEIAVIERWKAACPRGRGGSRFDERLAKARALSVAD